MGVLWTSQVHYWFFLFSQVLEAPVSQKDVFLSTMYSCLNRAILYCLSRPQQSLTEQFNLLNILSVLQEQWDIIFATYNSSNNFIICLMHCLCQLNSGRYKCLSQYDVYLTVLSYIAVDIDGDILQWCLLTAEII